MWRDEGGNHEPRCRAKRNLPDTEHTVVVQGEPPDATVATAQQCQHGRTRLRGPRVNLCPRAATSIARYLRSPSISAAPCSVAHAQDTRFVVLGSAQFRPSADNPRTHPAHVAKQPRHEFLTQRAGRGIRTDGCPARPGLRDPITRPRQGRPFPTIGSLSTEAAR
jgi:hypothetical protein